MAPASLDYRSPGTPAAPTAARAAALLRSREWSLRCRIAALLAAGLPACLFGPLVIGSVYWLLALIWTGSFALYVRGFWFFLGTAVLVIPLAFRTERRTRGRFLDEAVIDSARGDRPVLRTGLADVDAIFNFAMQPRLPAAGIVELILWGPRQVLDAVETVGRVRAVAPADRARTAALLLHVCARHAEGAGAVPTGVPVPADCAVPEWYRAIACLLVYDCIAVSADGSRMWPDNAVLLRLTGRGRDGDAGR